MSTTVEVILLVLAVLMLIGAVIWYYKERTWESFIAMLGSISGIIILLLQISSPKEKTIEKGQVNIDGNPSGPVIGNVENFYSNSKDTKTLDTVKMEMDMTKTKEFNSQKMENSPAGIQIGRDNYGTITVNPKAKQEKPLIKTSGMTFDLKDIKTNLFESEVIFINSGKANARNFSCKMLLLKIKEGGDVKDHYTAQSFLNEKLLIVPSISYTTNIDIIFEKPENEKISFYLVVIYYYTDEETNKPMISKDYFLVHHFPFKTFKYNFLNKYEEEKVKTYLHKINL